jgi:hypothetical protein
MPTIFLRNHNYNYNETYIYHGYILYKVKIIFPRSLLHYQHTFYTFAWDAVCRSRITLCWGVGALHARCVSVRHRPQNGVLGVHPSGGRKDGSRRVLSRDCREDEGEQSTPLLQLPPLYAGWCAVWRCHAGNQEIAFITKLNHYKVNVNDTVPPWVTLCSPFISLSSSILHYSTLPGCCCSYRWGKTVSPNCGHQRDYCSSPKL